MCLDQNKLKFYFSSWLQNRHTQTEILRFLIQLVIQYVEKSASFNTSKRSACSDLTMGCADPRILQRVPSLVHYIPYRNIPEWKQICSSALHVPKYVNIMWQQNALECAIRANSKPVGEDKNKKKTQSRQNSESEIRTQRGGRWYRSGKISWPTVKVIISYEERRNLHFANTSPFPQRSMVVVSRAVPFLGTLLPECFSWLSLAATGTLFLPATADGIAVQLRG